MVKSWFVSFLFTLLPWILHGQIIEKPVYALGSHPTLDILKIEASGGKTTVFLSIENRINGGTFCADANIYMIDHEGKRLKLEKSSGIPVCPLTYRFEAIGEILLFSLTFPPLNPGTKWVDIIEECNENCFSFYGVNLNDTLNALINEAISFAEKGEVLKAVDCYESILVKLGPTDNEIKGGIYTDLITLSLGIDDKKGAAEWYNKLVTSNIPRREIFIKSLNSRGIIF